MIKQFVKKEYDDAHIATLGLDFATKMYTSKVDGKEIPAKIWDTAG